MSQIKALSDEEVIVPFTTQAKIPEYGMLADLKDLLKNFKARILWARFETTTSKGSKYFFFKKNALEYAQESNGKVFNRLTDKKIE